MLAPKITNCKTCADILPLLCEINCKMAEMSIGLYNNIVFSLNLHVEYMKMLDLLNYKRILQAKLVNPDYACEFSINQIASKVKLMTLGCKSKSQCCITEIILSPTTTTTSTVACFRPVGLNNGSVVFNATVNDDIIWTFGEASPLNACPSFASFHDAVGSGFNVASLQIQYSSITVGEQVFINWGDVNCGVLFNGVFWINPTTQNSFDYFRDVTDIQIITVSGGVITSILDCSV
jgi:hypothetical protein